MKTAKEHKLHSAAVEGKERKTNSDIRITNEFRLKQLPKEGKEKEKKKREIQPTARRDS